MLTKMAQIHCSKFVFAFYFLFSFFMLYFKYVKCIP